MSKEKAIAQESEPEKEAVQDNPVSGEEAELVIVDELPTQPIREYTTPEGKKVKFMTVKEALAEILRIAQD